MYVHFELELTRETFFWQNSVLSSDPFLRNSETWHNWLHRHTATLRLSLLDSLLHSNIFAVVPKQQLRMDPLTVALMDSLGRHKYYFLVSLNILKISVIPYYLNNKWDTKEHEFGSFNVDLSRAGKYSV